jgi:hypothetical protein
MTEKRNARTDRHLYEHKKEIKPSVVYHKDNTLSSEIKEAAKEFFGILAVTNETVFLWGIAAVATGNSAPAWLPVSGIAALITVVGVVAYYTAKAVRERPVKRVGVISAETICRILKEDSNV